MQNRLSGLVAETPPKKIYKYEFCPKGSHSEDERDFKVTLFSDNTLQWDDAKRRARAIGYEKAFLWELIGHKEPISEAERRFLITTEATIGVITMIDRIKAFEAAQVPFLDETVQPLDHHLNEIFWAEVNSQLPEPLRRGVDK